MMIGCDLQLIEALGDSRAANQGRAQRFDAPVNMARAGADDSDSADGSAWPGTDRVSHVGSSHRIVVRTRSRPAGCRSSASHADDHRVLRPFR